MKKTPKELQKFLDVCQELENATDKKTQKSLLKQKEKLLRALRKQAAKEYKVVHVTYKKGALSNTYKYQGTPIEKHMKKMFEKGFAVQVQSEGGGQISLFKTFVKTSIFGPLGLMGNRTPKEITVTYIKEPQWLEDLPKELANQFKLYH